MTFSPEICMLSSELIFKTWHSTVQISPFIIISPFCVCLKTDKMSQWIWRRMSQWIWRRIRSLSEFEDGCLSESNEDGEDVSVNLKTDKMSQYPNSVIQPLQKIQNLAARLILLAPRHHSQQLSWKICTGFPFQNVLNIKSLVCVSML